VGVCEQQVVRSADSIEELFAVGLGNPARVTFVDKIKHINQVLVIFKAQIWVLHQTNHHIFCKKGPFNLIEFQKSFEIVKQRLPILFTEQIFLKSVSIWSLYDIRSLIRFDEVEYDHEDHSIATQSLSWHLFVD
jgi:hypothetical protein